jgi:hypothetical protein
MPVSVETPTVPFVRDAVLAAAVGSRYGVTLEHAARGIEAAGSLPGRLERIDRGQDAAVFVDTPSSMHAVAASMASLRRLTRGRLKPLLSTHSARPPAFAFGRHDGEPYAEPGEVVVGSQALHVTGAARW